MTQWEGWSNHETWQVNLWIANEEPSYRFWRERAREVLRAHPGQGAKVANDAISALADALEETLREQIAEGHERLPGFARDLLTTAFDEVNWREIALDMLSQEGSRR
jgi:hypothetical protein